MKKSLKPGDLAKVSIEGDLCLFETLDDVRTTYHPDNFFSSLPDVKGLLEENELVFILEVRKSTYVKCARVLSSRGIGWMAIHEMRPL